MDSRIEKDSFGPIEVPAAHLWGAQTQRSLEHFHISTERMAPELIAALAQVKRAAAEVNRSLGILDARRARVIVAAAIGCVVANQVRPTAMTSSPTLSAMLENGSGDGVTAARAAILPPCAARAMVPPATALIT